jgi:hypothetical protein
MEETSLAETLSYSFLNERAKLLKRIVRSSPEDLVPWIGAGLSVAAGFPSWRTFLEHLGLSLRPTDRETLERIVERGLFDVAADFVASLPEARIDAKMTESFGPTPRPPRSLRLLRKLGCTTFVTTNYDRLLESAMPWLVPLTPTNYRHAALRSQPCLLKIHGTIEQPETWTLTRSQYVRRYNEELVEDLRHIFRHKSVLFLGCSLHHDMYLDLLREVPKRELGSHFAVLNVASDDEAELRGEELEEIGIQVLPYRTMGRHALVEDILEHLLPPFESVSQRITEALNKGESQKALLLLRPWADDPGRHSVRKQVAYLSASLVGRLMKTASPDILDNLSSQAVDLDPTSKFALLIRAEYLESSGQASSSERAALSTLLQQTRHDLSKDWRPSDKRSIREVYEAFRTCNMDELQRWVHAIEQDRSITLADASDRLGILLLRAELTRKHPSQAENFEAQGFSQQIAPFAEALTAYHQGSFTKALGALETLEKRWRAASSGGGLAFSLQLKALCCLGEERDHDAFTLLDRCYSAYLEPQARLRRKFRRVPSELSYDIRSLSSPELYALIEFWRILAEINTRPEDVESSKIERAYDTLVKCAGGDPLVDWCCSLAAVLYPGGGKTASQLGQLVEQTKKKHPGLLRDVDVAVRAIARSQYAPEWFDEFRADVAAALLSP